MTSGRSAPPWTTRRGRRSTRWRGCSDCRSRVARTSTALREKVLSVRPGITDPVSLRFVDESALLARAADPEREYVEVVMPKKLAAAVAYAEHATLASDLRVIGQTLRALMR